MTMKLLQIPQESNITAYKKLAELHCFSQIIYKTNIFSCNLKYRDTAYCHSVQTSVVTVSETNTET